VAASLVNILGFTTGALLYGMLFWMVLRSNSDRLSLLTGALGLIWNIGAFLGYGLNSVVLIGPSPLLLAIAFSALGFLPAVVVHSVLRSRVTSGWSIGRSILVIAYALSFLAASLQIIVAVRDGAVPSQSGLQILTAGFVLLVIALLLNTRKEAGWAKSIWVISLAVFAVSALHLSDHRGTDPWWLELLVHNSSVPLALAFLHQDYRFALADIFLKRAVALVILVGIVFAIYVSGPTLITDQRSILLLFAGWIGTALIYPWIRSAASWFVDNVMLHRPDYDMLLAEATRTVARHDSVESIQEELSQLLQPALCARSIQWNRTNDADTQLPQNIVTVTAGRAAVAVIPTVEAPRYSLSISDLEGGRRLLSDDIAVIEKLALLTARRIDAIRTAHERFDRDLREREMSKLAAEAELRALRAQLHPHFLFNALTTIGYLIQTSPSKALGTLMQLSSLLRSVLRSGPEFSTLGEELKIIAAYLEIERARFEDRLSVRIDVGRELRELKLPALLLQPLVENAIKHGISKSIEGGEVRITADLIPRNHHTALRVIVEDTGNGGDDLDFSNGRTRGLGLNSVEKRLQYYGHDNAAMTITSIRGSGTRVEIVLPVDGATMENADALALKERM